MQRLWKHHFFWVMHEQSIIDHKRNLISKRPTAFVIAKRVNLFTSLSVYAQQIVRCTAPFADTSCLICWLWDCTRYPQMLTRLRLSSFVISPQGFMLQSNTTMKSWETPIPHKKISYVCTIFFWWRQGDSNPWPFECHSNALPTAPCPRCSI